MCELSLIWKKTFLTLTYIIRGGGVSEEIIGRLSKYDIKELSDGRVVVFTNRTYPDGDVVSLIIERRDGVLILTDAGETLSNVYSRFGTEIPTKFAREIASSLGVKFADGEFYVEIDREEAVTELIEVLSSTVEHVAKLCEIFIEFITSDIHAVCTNCGYNERVSFDKALELAEAGCDRCGSRVFLYTIGRKGKPTIVHIWVGKGNWTELVKSFKDTKA